MESRPTTADAGHIAAARLIRRLAALREPPMRQAVLAEQLAAMPADRAVAALAAVLERASRRDDPRARAAVDCLIGCLSTHALGYETRAALYAAAVSADAPAIANLFFDASPATAHEATLAKQLDPERAVVPRGRVLTLGERKALARSHRRELLAHLLRDPHPDVVEILLGNPHLTEADVVRLAARRPAVPAALAHVADSARWRTRYPVARALVCNPHTPVHLALRLCAALRARDLRQVAADASLPARVRAQARALLAP